MRENRFTNRDIGLSGGPYELLKSNGYRMQMPMFKYDEKDLELDD